MKQIAKLSAPVLFGFIAVFAAQLAVPQSMAFLQEDSSHIFDNGGSISVELPPPVIAGSSENDGTA